MTHQPCALSSLRQAAKASVLHTGIPRFESWSEHQYLSRSSMAERPADNRKTAERYRAGRPFLSMNHENHYSRFADNSADCSEANQRPETPRYLAA